MITVNCIDFLGLRGGCVESYDMIGRSDDQFTVHYMDINRYSKLILLINTLN